MILPSMTGCFFGEVKPIIAQKVDNVFRAQFAVIPEQYSFNSQFFIMGDRVYLMCSEQVAITVSPSEENHGMTPFEDGVAMPVPASGRINSVLSAAVAVAEGYAYPDEPYESYAYRTVLYSLDMNGENPEVELLTEHDDEAYLQCFTMSEDGSRVRIESIYDMETYENFYVLKSIAADGSEVFSVNAASFFPELDSEYAYFYPQDVKKDADGYIYVASGDGIIAVINPSGEKSFDIKIDGGYINQMEVIDGKVSVSYYDYNNGEYKFSYVNKDTKSFDSTQNFSDSINTSAYNLTFGNGYDVYLRGTTGLYAYNKGDADVTEIINWINSDINPNNVYDVKIISPEKFLYSGYNPITYNSEVAFLTRIPDDEVVPKYIITMASTGSATYEVLDFLIAFNRENEQYRIVLDDYSRYQTSDDYEMGVKVLNNDLAAGKIPDILIASGYDPLPLDSYEDKGLFADLYTYFDSDSDLSRDMILQCLRTPYEKNGKLYRFINSFLVRTVSAKVSSVGGNKTSWTISEMIELAKQSDADGKYLFSLMTKQSMLDNIAYMGINEFIDPETYQCSFDSQTFIDLLNYINTLPNEDEIDYDAYYTEMYENDDYYYNYKTGKILLQMEYLYSIYAYMETKYNTFGGDEFTYIGYPGAPGNGSAISPRLTYSISAKSHDTVREGSWQFIKFLLSDEIQGATRYQFPATYAALDKMLEEMKKEPWYVQGSLVPRDTEIIEETASLTDNGVTEETEEAEEAEAVETKDTGARDMAAPMPLDEAPSVFFNDDDKKFMLNFLDSIIHKGNDDSKILEIINEECGPFFAGSKSSEETAKVIQSKVSIYINESK